MFKVLFFLILLNNQLEIFTMHHWKNLDPFYSKQRTINVKIINYSENLKIDFKIHLKGYLDLELNKDRLIIIKKNFSNEFQFDLNKVHGAFRSYLYVFINGNNSLQIDVEDEGSYVIVCANLGLNLICNLYTDKEYQEELINQKNYFDWQDMGIEYHY